MRIRHVVHCLLVALVAALATPLPAAPAERVFEVTGTVRARLDDGRLVIAHDEITGFMRAMTMAFNVADPADAARLASGDRVRFRFRVGDRHSVADSFQITGRETAITTPAPTAAASGAPKRLSRLRAGDVVPAFALVDQDNQALTESAFRDRLTIVTFIFTRCPVPEYCPAMALRFRQLQETIRADAALAPRVRLLSITLDPEFDRPDILTAYGAAVGAEHDLWRFATGDKAQIDAFVKAFAVYNERNGATLGHTLCTALIDGDGRVRELWRGNGWKLSEILAALEDTISRGSSGSDAAAP